MKYDSIINLPHHVSKKRNKMSIRDRSAQFSSFDALTGFNDEIKETGRMVKSKIELSEEMKNKLDYKLNSIGSNKVSITYFVKDYKKEGGSYKNIISYIKKIDRINKVVIIVNNIKININDIIDIKLML